MFVLDDRFDDRCFDVLDDRFDDDRFDVFDDRCFDVLMIWQSPRQQKCEVGISLT